MRASEVTFDCHLVSAGHKLHSVSFSFVSQGVNFGGSDEGITEVTPIWGVQWLKPPTGPHLLEFRELFWWHAKVAKVFNPRPR